MIKIVPYQTTWPSEFQEIAAVLRSGLGELALRIDHIGSTSVPDLAAKDILDIQITVNQLDDQIIRAMSTLGYIQSKAIRRDHCPKSLSKSESDWSKLFFLSPQHQRPTYIHIRKKGKANQRYALLYRDFLREHPNIAESYAELKRRLAKYLADPQKYPEVKDPAVDLIYFAAKKWAETTPWQPGESDI